MVTSALEVWRGIPQTPEILEYFRGIFDIIGITIAETGEELTVAIEENRIRIDAGLPDNPDFVVPLKWENVEGNDVKLGLYIRLRAQIAWMRT